MGATTWMALVIAGVAAVLDWWAVARGDRRVEYGAKPAATFALLVVALSLDPEHDARRAWFVAGLALSLAGDIFLMLPRDRFVAGLASFLLGHLAYVVGFWVDDQPGGLPLVVGVVAVAVVVVVLARRILGGLRASGHGELVAPVTAYMGVIAVMVLSATGTGAAPAIVGAWLFLASDALIAWNRFVRPLAWAPVTIMVTYHLAQAGLVLSLV
jgi:alkenylglycerophosphocholine/alkenylglycerophosphoethanolamine hydrolase